MVLKNSAPYCFVLGKDGPQTSKIKVFGVNIDGKLEYDMTRYCLNQI